MSDLKKEFESFMSDIENIKEKVSQIEQKQQELENRIQRIEAVVGNIERDIYEEDGFDFEILCPYCNAEFVVDVDGDQLEVTCPECNNVIELDWTGNVEDEGFGCNYGGCATCGGCDTILGGNDEDDDM